MNNCSKIKCPLNALTFKNCNLTEKECCYFTKQPTNGDVLRTIFPKAKHELQKFYEEDTIVFDLDGFYMRISSNWWNAPYKTESEDKEWQ